MMKSRIGRREFLRGGLVTSAAVLVGGHSLFSGPAEARAEQFPDISIAEGNDPATLTRASVDALGGIKRFVKPGNKVVIKPNMSFAASPGEGATTHPAVVAEVARMSFEAGASSISVLDNVLQEPSDCLRLSRIPEYCNRVPNTVVANVQAQRMFRNVEVPMGKQIKSTQVMRQVLEADVLIVTPVGKTHSSSGVSLAMKGMMGLIFDRRCFHTRYDLHEAITDLITVLKPNLAVIDGTRILSSGGPRGPGEVIPLNMVIASTDIVAADAEMVAMGTWYGRKFKPTQVRHIRLAAERGLGRADLEGLTIKHLKT